MLPQRKKSAEEIAKLREGMGIPGEGQAPAPGEAGPQVAPPAAPPAQERAGVHPPGKKVELARHREAAAPPPTDPEPMEIPAVEEPIAPRQPKAVRSLRKSEQGIVERPPLDPSVSVLRVEGTALPQRRHNERELMELRRVQSAPPDQSVFHLKQQAAPWYWVILAYLLPLLGMLCAFVAHWLPDVPAPDFPTIAMAEFSRAPWLGSLGFGLLAGFCGLGLLMAGWFAWRKPRSRHHASFVAIIGLVILVFGIIHQFKPDYGP